MNKVIIVNLNGAAYQVEEAGFDALRAYLDTASRRLEGNPDRAEIISDIEQAIADKFRTLLTAHKNVITSAEVNYIITEMGPVEDASNTASTPAPGDPAGSFSGSAGSGFQSGPTASAGTTTTAGAAAAATTGVKRFYRLKSGALISGLLNGMGAYFNVDVTLVRAIFLVICLSTLFSSLFSSALLGTIGLAFFWVAIYSALSLIVPAAQTSAEESAAHGGHDAPRTAQEFIRRAKAGYYEGLKTWHDREGRREWKRKFKQDMKGWKRDFKAEVQRSSSQIGRQFEQHWSTGPLHAAGWIVLPALAIVQLLLVGLLILAVISLVNSGFVFGHPLLATMPIWKALLLIFVIYLALSLPLRGLRASIRGNRYSGSYYHHPAAGLSSALVAVGTMGLLVWLLIHRPTELGRAIGEVGAQFELGMRALENWVNRH